MLLVFLAELAYRSRKCEPLFTLVTINFLNSGRPRLPTTVVYKYETKRIGRSDATPSILLYFNSTT